MSYTSNESYKHGEFSIKILRRKLQKWLFGIIQMVRETKSPILVMLALLLWNLQTNIWCRGQIDPYPSLPDIGLSQKSKTVV